MKHSLQLTILVFMLTGLAACQDSDSNNMQTASESPTSTESSSTESPRPGDPTPSVATLFDDDMSKKGCEILTAELVAATFDVPVDDLKQFKIMGCRYVWDDDVNTVQAGISMLRVYKNEEAAANWFANATKSRTAEEMKAEMDKISGRLEESEQLDTELKKSTAKNVMKSIGSKAVNFEDVDGVGDEARVNDDGTVFVRVGNLTFMVSAYKGPREPPLDMTTVDLKQITKLAKENAAKYAIETAPQRKKDGAMLAGIIVDEL